MAKENTAGLGVYNVYGPRETDEARSGQLPNQGNERELYITFRGSNYNLVSATLPEGATFIRATAKIIEAFALGGTTPTINVGTSGSHGTNYAIELSEAQAEAADTVVHNTTGAGTFASPLAADTTVVVGLDGTTPTITDAGEATVIIRYAMPL